MKPKVITTIIQIIVWGVLLFLPMLFNPPPAPRGMHQMEVINPTVIILTTILPIGFYYFNYYLLIPLLYLRKKTFAYILSVIGSLVVIILFSIICSNLFNYLSENTSRPMPPVFVHSILLFVVVLFVSLGLRMNAEWKKTEEVNSESSPTTIFSQASENRIFSERDRLFGDIVVKNDLSAKLGTESNDLSANFTINKVL